MNPALVSDFSSIPTVSFGFECSLSLLSTLALYSSSTLVPFLYSERSVSLWSTSANSPWTGLFYCLWIIIVCFIYFNDYFPCVSDYFLGVTDYFLGVSAYFLEFAACFRVVTACFPGVLVSSTRLLQMLLGLKATSDSHPSRLTRPYPSKRAFR